LNHLGAALGVGAVILGDDLHRAAADAAGVVDGLGRGGRDALVPAPVGGTDAGAMSLEADLDRRRGLGLRIAHEARAERQRGSTGAEALQRIAASELLLRKEESVAFSVHCRSPVFRHSRPVPARPVLPSDAAKIACTQI